MTRLVPQTTPPAAPGIGAAECRQLVDDLARVMDALLATLEQETALVREGKLAQAAALTAHKGALAGRYLADTARTKANARAIAANLPGMLGALRAQHDSFRALLQVNMAVLATAHAVSEGIVRSAVGEVTRKAGPQTYGASGRTVAPQRHAAVAVAVSRVL